jgi:type VI secretion system secreted protein Hcp
MFLKVAGIKGESQDHTHKDEIHILSWSWGVTQAATSSAHGAGMGAGKADCHDLSIQKYLDIASPLLVKHCAAGIHIKDMLLTLRKAGEKQVEYSKMTLTDCLITSVQISAGGDLPSESVSFKFAKIKIEYWPQDAKGSLGGVVPYEWNIGTMKA